MKLKTRTNQPVYYKLPVSSDIQHMSDDLLNSLRVGDVVQKKTGNQKHCYIVTYKEEKKGICLTYVDGSGYMETISYDYTGGHWVYNSKDVTQARAIGDGDFSGIDLKAKTLEQSQPNWSLDLSSIPFDNLNEGLEYTPIYARLEVINNILYLVWLANIENTTENTIAVNNLSLPVDLSSGIASKIYDANGYSVHEASSGQITADMVFKGDNTYPISLNREKAICVLTNTSTPDRMKIQLFDLSSITAGVKQLMEVRTFLTLL